MHYIRFFKPPRLLPNSPQTLGAKITVTTDLGESFLWTDVALVVELHYGKKGSSGVEGKEYLWKGSNGMRSLEVVIPLSKAHKGSNNSPPQILVRPKQGKYAMDMFEAALGGRTAHYIEDAAGIVTVRSMDIQAKSSQTAIAGMSERVFSSKGKEIHIWEETGESIARHIWDAGLVFSCYLTTLADPPTLPRNPNPLPRLPILEKVLSKKYLNVLELGAGCGIVGITLATFFPTSRIILTDLPEATDILTHNLSLLPPSCKTTHQVLDWSQPLSSDISSQSFDLVVIADCTYNPDVVPDLVSTLRGVALGNSKVLILVAMKVRHESEAVFFDLMTEWNFEVVEKGEIPLPVLGGEDENIEIFGFQLEVR